MAKRFVDTNSNDKFALEEDLNSKATKSNITAGTKCKISYNSEGIVTYGGNLVASDIPSLAASKITSGTFASARLPTATSTAKGAVMPVEKTAEMTQTVGVDSSGRLYTASSGGGSSGVSKIIAGNNITISPESGTGEVTIHSSGGGGGGGGGLTGHKLTVNFTYGNPDSRYAVGECQGSVVCEKSDGTIEILGCPPAGDATKIANDVVAYGVIGQFNADLSHRDGRFIGGWSGYMSGIRLCLSDETVTVYSGCLLRGTRVILADHTEKPIEDITYEDELLVWDFENGCYDKAKPAWIKKREDALYYFKNRYASGKELLTTGRSETGWGHRHYDMTRNEFRYTPTTVGDTIFTLDGQDEHVSCEKISGVCEFYNIITEKHFNLFANKILTSCSLSNYRKMSNMKFSSEISNAIPFGVFKGFVDCDEDIAKKYFEKLGIGRMSIDDVSKIGNYVTNLIRKEQ